MKLSFLARAAGLAAAMLLAMAPLAAGAQAPYPDKPMRILVGASPGGGTDILARVLAEKFSSVLKQPVTVENRPGASNTIAGELTARAPADGATLLLATNTAQAVAPHILKLKYDPLKDLQPIGLVAVMPNVLVVSANSPYRSVKDLVAAMGAKPGGFKYASSGIGSTQHVGGEAFNLATGMKSIHVPYKGSSQAHVDIMSGEVDMMFDSTSSAMGQIKAGKFRALAVSAPQRSPELPDVPTIEEAALPGFDISAWFALLAPKATPAAIRQEIEQAAIAVLTEADTRERLRAAGVEVVAQGSGELERRIISETTMWRDVVTKARIRAE